VSEGSSTDILRALRQFTCSATLAFHLIASNVVNFTDNTACDLAIGRRKVKMSFPCPSYIRIVAQSLS